MDFLLLKTIHIISSTILFGTGIGSAFYMFIANRRKNIIEMNFAVKFVVIADFIFTLPSVIIQLVTGILMVQMLGLNYNYAWVKWGLILYLFAGACWLPVVFIQMRMEKLLSNAITNNTPLDDKYWLYDKLWCALGALAFPAIIIVFYLMVNKPI